MEAKDHGGRAALEQGIGLLCVDTDRTAKGGYTYGKQVSSDPVFSSFGIKCLWPIFVSFYINER